jgi:hypothetical protein
MFCVPNIYKLCGNETENTSDEKKLYLDFQKHEIQILLSIHLLNQMTVLIFDKFALHFHTWSDFSGFN